MVTSELKSGGHDNQNPLAMGEAQIDKGIFVAQPPTQEDLSHISLEVGTQQCHHSGDHHHHPCGASLPSTTSTRTPCQCHKISDTDTRFLNLVENNVNVQNDNSEITNVLNNVNLCSNNKINNNVITKILGLNVCGFRSKINNGLFDEYAKNYDILCLSETKVSKISDIDLKDSSLNDYHC